VSPPNSPLQLTETRKGGLASKVLLRLAALRKRRLGPLNGGVRHALGRTHMKVITWIAAGLISLASFATLGSEVRYLSVVGYPLPPSEGKKRPIKGEFIGQEFEVKLRGESGKLSPVLGEIRALIYDTVHDNCENELPILPGVDKRYCGTSLLDLNGPTPNSRNVYYTIIVYFGSQSKATIDLIRKKLYQALDAFAKSKDLDIDVSLNFRDYKVIVVG
jgi:hypothetical protein